MCACLAACGGKAPNPVPAKGQPAAAPSYEVDEFGYPLDHRKIEFRDDAKTNAKPESRLADLEFVDAAGNPVALKDHLGERIVVLVITRGATAQICVYCSTQTSRLIAAYDEFTKRGAEVLVVYPVESSENQQRLGQFLESARKKLAAPETPVPFPIVLDLNLKAVDRLAIRKDLSKPATYILDKQGEVRFAYVGQTPADRPSVKALLAQLDEINQGTPPAAAEK